MKNMYINLKKACAAVLAVAVVTSTSLSGLTGFAAGPDFLDEGGLYGMSPQDVYVAPHDNEDEGASAGASYYDPPGEPSEEPGGEPEEEPGEGPGEEPEEDPEEEPGQEETEEPEEEPQIEIPQGVFGLSFNFDGDLYITLEEYEEAFELALALAIAQALAEGLEEDDVDRNAV
ncbi:MAG: hypothetical protein FWE19_09265, partial [Oscillospiraceae bacterium]|nr:hypothetical protein [Oscillospiraceae bacterium]